MNQQQAHEVVNDAAYDVDSNNQLNRKIGIAARLANNFSFVDLNVLPQEQREAIEASARHLKEASEMRQKEQPDV